MTGKQLFEKYTKVNDDYAQTLWTARASIADDEKFFNLLKDADAAGKQLSIVEPESPLDDSEIEG